MRDLVIADDLTGAQAVGGLLAPHTLVTVCMEPAASVLHPRRLRSASHPGRRRRGLKGQRVHIVTGPTGADSVFYRALRGHHDAVISLNHDQGHIAAKIYDFEHPVSLTLGLRFIRASVDHGTAFDIAGQGLASAEAQIEALLVAARDIARSLQRDDSGTDRGSRESAHGEATRR